MHIIWQIMGENERDEVQRDFLKFTAQQILKILRNEKSPLQDELLVNAKTEVPGLGAQLIKYTLWSDKVMWQKLDYIHNNPVKAQLCRHPEDYKYSSASFYLIAKSVGIF
jgi:hypothetical protein